MNKPGIYKIMNKKDGRYYVGSAVSIRKRWACHKTALTRNQHHNIWLQRAWNKDGAASFEFSVVELVAELGQLIAAEQRHIDANVGGYNLSQIAGSTLGVKYSEESKRLLSESAKKRVFSPETRAKMSASLRLRVGEKRSAETRAKIAARATGRKASAETRLKLSQARLGKKLSPEHAANLAASNRRRAGVPMSEESRKRMSESAKKRVARSNRGGSGRFVELVMAFGAQQGVMWSEDA